MSHVPHELADEFPAQKAKIHELKLSNLHFAQLADKYHDLNREIHRAEVGVEAMSDESLETLKKKRLQLKDELSSLLTS
jgi:uncharacterized protein YdcH (DUF465 family)